MTDYEMLIVILTIGMLIVQSLLFVSGQRNKPPLVQEVAAYKLTLRG